MDAREAVIAAAAPNVVAQIDNCFPKGRVPSLKHAFDGIIDEKHATSAPAALPDPPS
jgi:hypothetical protein